MKRLIEQTAAERAETFKRLGTLALKALEYHQESIEAALTRKDLDRLPTPQDSRRIMGLEMQARAIERVVAGAAAGDDAEYIEDCAMSFLAQSALLIYKNLPQMAGAIWSNIEARDYVLKQIRFALPREKAEADR